MGAVIVASFVVVSGLTWIVSVWRYVAAPSLEQTVQSLEKNCELLQDFALSKETVKHEL